MNIAAMSQLKEVWHLYREKRRELLNRINLANNKGQLIMRVDQLDEWKPYEIARDALVKAAEDLAEQIIV